MSSARPEVSKFFSSLHAALFKPAGYTKVRRTFTKREAGYTIAFQFQGSDWNDSSSPWTFYLNAGIQFPDIPRRSPDRDFPTISFLDESWIHVGQRREASHEVEVGNNEILIQTIASIVEDARTYFAQRHGFIRERYVERPVSYLGYIDESLMKRGISGEPSAAGSPVYAQ